MRYNVEYIEINLVYQVYLFLHNINDEVNYKILQLILLGKISKDKFWACERNSLGEQRHSIKLVSAESLSLSLVIRVLAARDIG